MRELLTTILLPALGALLGAWAGSRAALDKLRSERAFERRLEWYDHARETLAAFRSALNAAINHEKLLGFDEEAKRLWLASTSAYLPVTAAMEQAEAYAPNRSILRLRHLHEDFRAFANQVGDGSGPVRAVRERWLEAAVYLSGSARDASICLASDLRRHLDLDVLDLEMLKEGTRLPPLPRP